MLTLRDLVRDLDVSVLAGEPGVDAPVRWVHISELTDPTPWLSGGELLLTTGMALDTPEQHGLIERFFRRFKEECAWQQTCTSVAEARRAVRAWLEWYNHERPHQALG